MNQSERLKLIDDLLWFAKPVEVISSQLKLGTWDYDGLAPVFTQKHLSHALNKYLKKEIIEHDLQEWAELIECREDIDFSDSLAKEVMFQLANSEINIPGGKINEFFVRELLKKLEA